MTTIILTSLLALGGVGVLLGVIAATKFAALWRICRYYYAAYAVLLATAFIALYIGDPAHPSLLDLVKELGFGIVASIGWGIWAHLNHTASSRTDDDESPLGPP